MICTWLTEIMLNQMNSAEEALHLSKAALDRNLQDNSNTHQIEYERCSANFAAAVKEFRNFLTLYKVFWSINNSSLG